MDRHALGGTDRPIYPLCLIWEAAIGAGAGALIGHFWRGLSRSDMKAIGDALEENSDGKVSGRTAQEAARTRNMRKMALGEMSFAASCSLGRVNEL